MFEDRGVDAVVVVLVVGVDYIGEEGGAGDLLEVVVVEDAETHFEGLIRGE